MTYYNIQPRIHACMHLFKPYTLYTNLFISYIYVYYIYIFMYSRFLWFHLSRGSRTTLVFIGWATSCVAHWHPRGPRSHNSTCSNVVRTIGSSACIHPSHRHRLPSLHHRHRTSHPPTGPSSQLPPLQN